MHFLVQPLNAAAAVARLNPFPLLLCCPSSPRSKSWEVGGNEASVVDVKPQPLLFNTFRALSETTWRMCWSMGRHSSRGEIP